MSVLGFSLENADLLYCVLSHERVYVDVSSIDDYPEGMYVPQFIRFLSPTEVPAVTDIDELTVDQKFQLILWLNMRTMTYGSLKKVLENKAPSRYYIPFPQVLNYANLRSSQFKDYCVMCISCMVNFES